jgi:hypothetical protein
VDGHIRPCVVEAGDNNILLRIEQNVDAGHRLMNCLLRKPR